MNVETMSIWGRMKEGAETSMRKLINTSSGNVNQFLFTEINEAMLTNNS